MSAAVGVRRVDVVRVESPHVALRRIGLRAGTRCRPRASMRRRPSCRRRRSSRTSSCRCRRRCGAASEPSAFMTYSWSQLRPSRVLWKISRLPSALKYASAFSPPYVSWRMLARCGSAARGASGGSGAGCGRACGAAVTSNRGHERGRGDHRRGRFACPKANEPGLRPPARWRRGPSASVPYWSISSAFRSCGSFGIVRRNAVESPKASRATCCESQRFTSGVAASYCLRSVSDLGRCEALVELVAPLRASR